MKMLSEESSSVSSALLSVASSSKGSAQAGGAIVAAPGLPRLGRVDLCTRWAASSLRLLPDGLRWAAPGVRAACGSRGWHEFAFSSAPFSISKDSSAAPEGVRRRRGRLRRPAAGEKTRNPGKTQRAEQPKVDSAAPRRKGSHDEPWRRHGVDAQ